MRALIACLVLSVGISAHADDNTKKKAGQKTTQQRAEAPPQAAFPVGTGQPIEKLPNKLKSEDQKELLFIQLQEQYDALLDQNVKLQRQLADTSEMLLKCQTPSARQSRDTRRKEIYDRYRMNSGDTFQQEEDGSISVVRKQQEKK